VSIEVSRIAQVQLDPECGAIGSPEADAWNLEPGVRRSGPPLVANAGAGHPA
jgi:hypothetical protein